ncbi:hypothetical protein CQ040_14770 [Microbacterium sp. MYb54]|nr:hypothetical protein CQ032_19195 [Microbacterium sp. MYb43]PQZ72857.1 hypothetical protein CQ031_18040 [Microbacterium sp. MYb40]PRB19673.1 hypothetical protein CQ040_14770 [Microbacterium sp. MYb54]PRB23361.1 hypothetical protein CQ037_17855 [Microbacterium sp. MYb50]PRB61593.1 hypothetical protein CQ021_18035 [Microbacterium sp. MYb24]PRB70565.1 hypothetical protein CQ027_16540 [Microbacterium sp. MYb32]
MAAAAVGLVMTMTGCGTTAAPEGDALYRDGEKNYVAYSTVMHSVIMAIHEGEWVVDQGSFGASPIPCRINGEVSGYTFSWARVLEPTEEIDVDAVVAAATTAFEEAGVEASTATFGEGDRQEVNVIGTGGDVGRGVVTIRPGRNQISASATPGCIPGDAADLSDMVFGGELSEGESLRFPAFEGPDWQPRFYFPEGGSPVYYNEDGTPVDPQPTQTKFPVAPYGD